MTTNMRVIIATVGVAVLVSPVMAQQSEPHPQSSAASIARTHGSVTRTHAHRVVQHRVVHSEPVEDGAMHTDDCRSIFGQCGFAH
jgi:hypothetical protein